MLLGLEVGEGDVIAGQSANRCFEIFKGRVVDPCNDLRGDAAGAMAFMDHDAASRSGNGVADGLGIHRRDREQVDQFHINVEFINEDEEEDEETNTIEINLEITIDIDDDQSNR